MGDKWAELDTDRDSRLGTKVYLLRILVYGYFFRLFFFLCLRDCVGFLDCLPHAPRVSFATATFVFACATHNCKCCNFCPCRMPDLSSHAQCNPTTAPVSSNNGAPLWPQYVQHECSMNTPFLLFVNGIAANVCNCFNSPLVGARPRSDWILDSMFTAGSK